MMDEDDMQQSYLMDKIGQRMPTIEAAFVESSSSAMLEAEGSRPPRHLAQLRTTEQASVACTTTSSPDGRQRAPWRHSNE